MSTVTDAWNINVNFLQPNNAEFMIQNDIYQSYQLMPRNYTFQMNLDCKLFFHGHDLGTLERNVKTKMLRERRT